MSSLPSVSSSRRAAIDAVTRLDILRILLIAALHLSALALMTWSEPDIVAKLVFVLIWGLLNFFWLAVLRRPAVAAALSLAMILFLILVSRLKYEMVWLTANFLDVMILNLDTVRYLLTVMPDLQAQAIVALALAVPLLGLIWWIDRFRIRRRTAILGFLACFVGMSAVALAFRQEPWEAYFGDGYVSRFVRSGAEAISVLLTHGYMESDAAASDRLKALPDATCTPIGKPPHIIVVHDESSFDIRVLPGVKVAADYGPHFRSFDGKARQFVVEGVGGPSWFTEYNVFAGLSARSFGRFAYYVTQIAAGRVERGLPTALRRCGYRTFSIYPARGAFMSVKSFQTTTGVQSFIDQDALRTDRIEPDRFYYDAALRMIERERRDGPTFMFVYLGANHYPWDYRWRPDLSPEWKDLGNTPEVDEYLRRQALSFRDYADLTARLERDFPGKSFLLVRFGDHQPGFASSMLEPTIDEAARSQRLLSYDARYYTTYYALDAINFKPLDLGSMFDTIDAPYLPLAVLEAAGLPLEPSFAEQKRIMERCKGLFYACKDGAEARRFNRLLIDAGLIKGL